MMNKSDNEVFDLLQSSLNEIQVSVRAYDTKAQIVGVGYIFALNVIGQIGNMLPEDTNVSVLTILVAWTLVILPIILFGYVLYPVRKSFVKETEGERKHVFFFHPEHFETESKLISAVRECNPMDEIAYELLKVSELRESKRNRFVRGLVSAAAAFALLFVHQIYVSLSMI